MRATINFEVSEKSLRDFDASLNIVLTKVGKGSRKALVAALEEIQAESLAQVPQDTSTLANSCYYEVDGDYKTGWRGTIGYGKPNYINPKTGKSVASYMMTVHEDLTAYHAIGKAKFLEDPVRAYAVEKFPRTVFKYAQESLSTTK